MIVGLLRRRAAVPFSPGIKVNLYRDYEYRAAARAISSCRSANVETVMVGDSFFTTHLGRDSTQLCAEDQALALEILPRLVAEVRAEIDHDRYGIGRPLLMADLPDLDRREQVRQIIAEFARAGADCVKFEVLNAEDLWLVRPIRDAGMIPAMHLGYTPQKNSNRAYGRSQEEVAQLMQLLVAGRERGVEILTLERLTELANVLITRRAISGGLLPYSIFSGRAAMGGQSLNIWDAVVKRESPSIFFPPTAVLERGEVSRRYDEDLVGACFSKLLALTAGGIFPPSPHNRLAVDECLTMLEHA